MFSHLEQGALIGISQQCLSISRRWSISTTSHGVKQIALHFVVAPVVVVMVVVVVVVVIVHCTAYMDLSTPNIP